MWALNTRAEGELLYEITVTNGCRRAVVSRVTALRQQSTSWCVCTTRHVMGRDMGVQRDEDEREVCKDTSTNRTWPSIGHGAGH